MERCFQKSSVPIATCRDIIPSFVPPITTSNITNIQMDSMKINIEEIVDGNVEGEFDFVFLANDNNDYINFNDRILIDS